MILQGNYYCEGNSRIICYRDLAQTSIDYFSSSGDSFSSQGVDNSNMSEAYNYQPGMKFQRDDPFDTSEEEEAASRPSVESLEPTGDPFMDSCLLGQHHRWYHRTYDACPVYDDSTPWWQDYLDDAERFGCGGTDSDGRPRSRVAAIAALLKENNISKTRPLRYTLRALYQLDQEPYERADRSGVDEHQCQRYRSLCLAEFEKN